MESKHNLPSFCNPILLTFLVAREFQNSCERRWTASLSGLVPFFSFGSQPIPRSSLYDIVIFLQLRVTIFLQHHIAIFLQLHIAIFLQHHIAILLQHHIALSLQLHIALSLQLHIAIFLQLHIVVFLQLHITHIACSKDLQNLYESPRTTSYKVRFSIFLLVPSRSRDLHIMTLLSSCNFTLLIFLTAKEA